MTETRLGIAIGLIAALALIAWRVVAEYEAELRGLRGRVPTVTIEPWTACDVEPLDDPFRRESSGSPAFGVFLLTLLVVLAVGVLAVVALRAVPA